jgi:hypothetical protein
LEKKMAMIKRDASENHPEIPKSTFQFRDERKLQTQSILKSFWKDVVESAKSGKLTARETAINDFLQNRIIKSGFGKESVLGATISEHETMDDIHDLVAKQFAEFNATQDYLLWDTAFEFLVIGYLSGILGLKNPILERIAKEDSKKQTESARKARWPGDKREKINLKSNVCAECADNYLNKNATKKITMNALVTAILPDIYRECRDKHISEIPISSVKNYLRKIENITSRIHHADRYKTV